MARANRLRTRIGTARTRLDAALAQRLTPERTRKATLIERLTVQRLSWDNCVRFNRWLEVLGWIATAAWVAFMGTVLFGVDWKDPVENAVNSGRPVKAAVVLVVVVPTLLFVAVRSLAGFARWRIQRELWRRDVDRLRGPDGR